MSDVMVLNFSYEPLNVVKIRRAVRLVFAGKAEILEDAGTIASPTFEMRLPSVIRMLYFIRYRKRHVALSKKNVLLRDDYTCQYCGQQGGSSMTVDHVTPRSRGGPSSWENLVCACVPCNQRKRDRTPGEAGMRLRRTPKVPHYIPWIRVQRHTARDEWAKHITLYSVSIDERVEA